MFSLLSSSSLESSERPKGGEQKGEKFLPFPVDGLLGSPPFGALLLVVSDGAACQGSPGLSSVLASYKGRETWLRPYDWTYLRGCGTNETNSEEYTSWDMFQRGQSTNSRFISYLFERFIFKFLLNGSVGGAQNLSTVELCIPFQKNLTVILTNEQISPGIWYIGFFNGLGPARTQSKMICGGKAYVFSTSIFVEECVTSTIWGPYCNQTVNMISCSKTQSLTDKLSRSLLDLAVYESSSLNHMVRTGAHRKAGYHLLSERCAIEEKQVMSNTSVLTTAENLITCSNSIESSCLRQGELKFHFLDILGLL